MTELTSRIGWMDIVIVMIVAWGLVRGWRHGLSVELPRLASVLIATVVSLHYYAKIGALFSAVSMVPSLAGELLAFLLLAVLSFIIILACLSLVGRIVQLKFIESLERLGGVLVGGARFYLMLALFIAFLKIPSSTFLESALVGRSLLWGEVSETSRALYDIIVHWFV